ncbi:hypothetical protein [Kitasatospora sp. NPDC127116]|uniref:hypothetical protein n=1 Tax=Kitasatospora sp. NPDC127116 TaxID=3345367 RepID=UPI0036307BA6
MLGTSRGPQLVAGGSPQPTEAALRSRLHEVAGLAVGRDLGQSDQGVDVQVFGEQGLEVAAGEEIQFDWGELPGLESSSRDDPVGLLAYPRFGELGQPRSPGRRATALPAGVWTRTLGDPEGPGGSCRRVLQAGRCGGQFGRVAVKGCVELFDGVLVFGPWQQGAGQDSQGHRWWVRF